MFAASKTDSASTGGYQISRSLRFNSADSAYLNRTPATTTNRTTFTWSGWIKRTTLGGQYIIYAAEQNDNLQFWVQWDNDTINVFDYQSAYNLRLITTAVYRDPSAWYHIVIAVDTTQATSSNRIKLYVNGVQVTSFTTETYPSQNYTTMVNYTSAPNFLGKGVVVPRYLPSYMTEVNLIDGSQLTPSSFGETNAQTGVWQPKAYSGSYGTNGFYLNFSDNSNTTAATLGKDYSGNGNNWTPNNFSVTAGAGNDSLVDSPTAYGTTDTGVGGEIRGNYSTWNPLQQLSSLPSNGNLFVETNGNVGDGAIRNTLGLSSGKWYFEATVSTNYPSNWNAGVIELTGASNAIATSNGNSTSKFAFILGGGTLTWYKKTNSSLTAISPSGCADGTVMSIAVDLDSGKMWVAKNGTWADSGDPSTGTNAQFTSIPSDTYLISAFPYKDGAGYISFNANFGQRPFAYTAPSGFKALCTQNLPTPTIGATTATQAGKYFNPVLYTGTGSTRTVTGVGFSPDWVWIKSRSAAYNNRLYDRLRGVENVLQSNSTAAEASDGGGLTAFGSDGFTLGSSVSQNESASTFVAWNWLANGSGSTNTAGSITSTVSASTTSGFSVVTYTGNGTGGATIGHGLGVAPAMVIVKRLNLANDWRVYHISLGATQYIDLNVTNAAATATVVWNNTAPTTSVFTVGTSPSVNTSGGTHVAYCFAEVAGYSKFGSYTGNGSADGPFVYTGFRPAWVLIKRSDGADNWHLLDNKRAGYNSNNNPLYPDASAAEGSGFTYLDLTSNGFKSRNNSFLNNSGVNYIYAAFAEVPLKFSLAR
jgi:hypothetical protein